MSRATISKHPLRYPAGYPQSVEMGRGAYVWSDKRKKYIDWVQGLGTVGLFGHRSVPYVKALAEADRAGSIFHVPHILEAKVSEMLCDILPAYAEDVRWCLNGTDAMAGAVRLARAVTGKSRVIVFRGHYHGESSADWAIAAKRPARGVSENTIPPVLVDWNDVAGLEQAAQRVGYDLAAIVASVEAEEPTPEFVVALRQMCDRHNALLIMDEVVTGLRFGLGGACEYYGIEPDLAAFGKAIGSGIPAATLVGKREYMREFDIAYTTEPVFMSFTGSGHPLSLAAVKYTLEALEDGRVIEYVWEVGAQLMDWYRRWTKEEDLGEVIEVVGQPPRHGIRFHDANGVSAHALMAVYQQSMKYNGILVGWTNCPTVEHGKEELRRTAAALSPAFTRIRCVVDTGKLEHFLEGEAPQELYVRGRSE